MGMVSSSAVCGMNWKKCVGRSGRSFVVAQDELEEEEEVAE